MTGTAHLLVVEDDQSLRDGLRVVLEQAGYQVSTAVRGEDALKLIRASPPDLVVLDLMLPGLDGRYVLERSRAEGFTAPVIILSARDSLEDKLRGLDTGADDYVTKPFEIEELLARIMVRLRSAAPLRRFAFGEFVVDLDAGELHRNGKLLHLTPKEFDLLAFFLQNPNHALSRSRILEQVWGQDYRGTGRTVDNFVRGLRTKIEQDPERPRFLRTVRARGYRFNPRG